MKKILMALVMISGSFISANAQTKCVCPVVKRTVHHKTTTHANYAQNFKVCKNQYGYHICGEVSTCYNSTYCIPGVNTAGPMVASNNSTYNDDDVAINYQPSYETANTYYGNMPAPAAAAVAPQSQSYPVKTDLRQPYVNNGQDNVVVAYDNGTAPYDGLPSPQDDGPNKNKARNLNENSPAQNTQNPELSLPPASGKIVK